MESRRVFLSVSSVTSYCTKMYPMALISFLPLSADPLATFPHVLDLSGCPPAPNPIRESQEPQFFSLLLRIPILAPLFVHTALKPSVLQLCCKEASDPISAFHVSRPSEVARYCPSAISEYKELACFSMAINLI